MKRANALVETGNANIQMFYSAVSISYGYRRRQEDCLEPGENTRCFRTAVVLLLRAAFVARRHHSKPAAASGSNSAIAAAKRAEGHGLQPRRSRFSRLPSRGGPPPTDEEIVAAMLNQFSRSRRALVHSLARHAGKQVPKVV